ncbi:unnamed protein product [Aphanomyces euteiches]|uniref:EamA domain-containing protein n=1 Tax=Aphanomyces euteiches TaxID=100861 RepID=A0A6G0XV22_9STRA|nr:hypothetical protein Ae201684_000787 [Aphanomyces euteiches]KAH9100056.1 hypothetical protein Ae201684P_019059 [Aphanomyces euteiches]KAH9153538.1 hypothetical protein AeRB84_004228 [Aphanomyces euteiches]
MKPSMADENDPLVAKAPVETPAPSHRLLGLSLVAFSAVTFSLMTSGIKFESAYMTSMETMFWRSCIGWLLNLTTIFATRTTIHVDADLVPYIVFRCLVGFGSTALCFWTISQMALADASCIIFINPVLTFLLGAVFLGEHLNALDFSLALVSFGGVVCVARPTFLFGHTDDTTRGSDYAVVGGLVSASCQAMAYITLRKTKAVDPLVMIHYFLLSGMLGAASWIAFFQLVYTLEKSLKAWAICIGTGVLGFVGQVALTKGFQLEKAGIASMMRYLDIVLVFIWDSVLLKEPINLWSVAGALIILSSAIGIAVHRAHST